MHEIPSIFTADGKQARRPPRDELFLTEQLELLGPDNRVIRLYCSATKAKWWAGIAQGIINRSARESLMFLPFDDPNRGLGSYAHVEVSYSEEGLKLEWLHEIPYSPALLISQAVAIGRVRVAPTKDGPEALQELKTKLKGALARIREREKYVELHIMWASVSLVTQRDAIIIVSTNPTNQPLDRRKPIV